MRLASARRLLDASWMSITLWFNNGHSLHNGSSASNFVLESVSLLIPSLSPVDCLFHSFWA